MKILICGGQGQLGFDCNRVFSGSHRVLSCSSHDLDITDPEMLDRKVQDFRPDIVVNCAAFTRVDACETERERAWEINAEGPGNIARTVGKYGGRIFHISTDYVFDGRKRPPEAYHEDDETSPLSHYGRTKLEGERAVRKITDDHVILRTSWLYGIKGTNFLKTILRLSRKDPEKEIKVVHDQYGSPTWSYRLAQQINTMLDTRCRGTYHVTSEGHCTWFELARYFLEGMGIQHNLVPCETKEYPTPAQRPKNSILENRRLKEEGLNLMLHWKRDMDQFLEEFKATLIEECDRSLQSRSIHTGLGGGSISKKA